MPVLDLIGRMGARYAHLAPELWVEQACVFRVATGARHHLDVAPMAFTAAVVTTPIASPRTYEGRWCYPDVPAALAAARTWLGEGGFPGGEPAGWQRHPASGRRRPGGDAAGERVAL